jgi:hypothetical protein
VALAIIANTAMAKAPRIPATAPVASDGRDLIATAGEATLMMVLLSGVLLSTDPRTPAVIAAGEMVLFGRVRTVEAGAIKGAGSGSFPVEVAAGP